MKRYFSLCLLCLLSSSPVLAAQSDTVVAENAHVRLVFATKPVPSLQQLVHKPSGTNLLAEPAGQALFTLEVADPKGGTASVESQRAKQGSVAVTPVAGGQQIVIEFSGLGPSGDLRVNIEGLLDDAEPLVRWSIAVDNPGRQRLTTVRFPYIAAVPAIGSPDDDFVVAPAMPGALIERPAEQWPANYSLGWSFPGNQSVQFFSYQDRTAGVYLASMDTVGYGRALQISKRNDQRYLLYQEYRLPNETEEDWQSPYKVALGVTSGTWQQTADLYKRWAVKQPWCARTLSQRDDIPDAWKRGPCIHTVEVRTYDAERLCNGSYYPKLLEHLRLLRERMMDR